MPEWRADDSAATLSPAPIHSFAEPRTSPDVTRITCAFFLLLLFFNTDLIQISRWSNTVCAILFCLTFFLEERKSLILLDDTFPHF